MRSYVLSGASQKVPLPPSPFIYYRGFSIRETAGAAATIKVYDGIDATGTLIDSIAFTAGQSVRETYGPPKICKTGLYVQIVAGTIEGTILFD